jgi:hypothetical protein
VSGIPVEAENGRPPRVELEDLGVDNRFGFITPDAIWREANVLKTHYLGHDE